MTVWDGMGFQTCRGHNENFTMRKATGREGHASWGQRWGGGGEIVHLRSPPTELRSAPAPKAIFYSWTFVRFELS